MIAYFKAAGVAHPWAYSYSSLARLGRCLGGMDDEQGWIVTVTVT